MGDVVSSSVKAGGEEIIYKNNNENKAKRKPMSVFFDKTDHQEKD
jgi:hypothetical protein